MSPFYPWRDSLVSQQGWLLQHTWHTSPLCRHMTKVRPAETTSQLPKPSPRKSLKNKQPLTTQVKSLLSTLMRCSPITEHTRSACFQGIAHPSSCRVPPLQLLCPGCSAQGGWKRNRPRCLPPPPGQLSLLFQKELLSGGTLLDFSYF